MIDSTDIRIEKTTRDRLHSIMNKNEGYDSFIIKMMNKLYPLPDSGIMKKECEMKSNIIKAFIISVPISVMILFTWIAFKSHGIFEIDMTYYGEYEIEMGILFLWFILFLKSIKENIK